MFYRRKLILSLLQTFGGKIEKDRFQELLFLLTRRQQKPEYDFVPSRVSCYSFSANADIETMMKKGMLKEKDQFITRTDKEDYIEQLQPEDRAILPEIKSEYAKMNVENLMRYIFHNYPFYAIKSDIAEKILGKKELKKVKVAQPKRRGTILFTIGYEGISPEEYLVRLLQHDIKVLVDVRNNPLSMKFGFSKNQLKTFCESLHIAYAHFPEVGIQSDQRHGLSSRADYDKLFEKYRKENLPSTKKVQKEILNLLMQSKRIALTCFEADVQQCHRKYLAEAIQKLPGFDYEVRHI